MKFANVASELLAIETVHEKPGNSIVIISIYRPFNTIFSSFLQVIANICELIFDVQKMSKRIIITGDFNLDLLKHDCDSRVNQFCNILNSFGLYSIITEATRIAGNTLTLIDNIFINFAEQSRYLGILLDELSDHLPVYFRFNAQYNYVKNYHDSGGDVIKLNFKKENFSNFYAVLKETDWFGLNSEYDSYGYLVYYKDNSI